MATNIEMPKLSDTMTEGTLVKWRKKPGDKVEVGDILAEIETDKATMEMEAFDEGVLGEVSVHEGDRVAVGQLLAVLLAPGEKAGAAAAAPAKTQKKREAAPEPAPAVPAAPKAEAPAKPAPAAAAPVSTSRVKASPLARKVAAAKGLDLGGITGTGPGGRIVAADVETARPGVSKGAAPAPAAAPVPVPVVAAEGGTKISLSGMRRIIAERLLASKTQIPHFYLNIEVDAGELMKLRSEFNAAAEKAGQQKLTVNDFVLKAAITAAVRVPQVNASFAGDSIIQYPSVHMAVAVAIDEGLVTPVIRDAQQKSLREISDAVKDVATRARNKKLKPEEFQGGTITVSNLGAYGIESFSAIINPPQAVILAIGAVVKKPVVNAKNEIVVGQRMAIGMSCDHRVVDGAIGAQYLAELRRFIENPALMLI